MNELKYCKFCDKEKPIKDFVKSGFATKNICKECQNKKQTQIYKNSKEVDKLKHENKQLKIQISAREEEYRELEDKYKELDKMCELYSKSLYNAELNQYKNNWNKLEKWIFEEHYLYIPGIARNSTYQVVLDKMHELEQESDYNE